jgi:cobalt-precorrin 5A hydrolase
MGGSEAMAVIGIGTTSRVTVDDVLSVIEAAFEKAESQRVKGAMHSSGARTSGGFFEVLATLDRPAINPILEQVAFDLGLCLRLLPLEELRVVADRCLTRSEKSMKQYGIPSVAEASALAAAGVSARLLIPRFCGRNTTASVAIIS